MRDLRKCFLNSKAYLINQYIVEQAPSPAKYSRGRLFTMIFQRSRNYFLLFTLLFTFYLCLLSTPLHPHFGHAVLQHSQFTGRTIGEVQAPARDVGAPVRHLHPDGVAVLGVGEG